MSVKHEAYSYVIIYSYYLSYYYFLSLIMIYLLGNGGW